jgi:para-nitrobenzyl esterase
MNFQGAGGKAMHTIDIPFMFDNIAMAEGQIGSAPKQLAAANALAATMSEMLIAYARSGNPNCADQAGTPLP